MKQKTQTGFTLIEVMVVIVILAVMATIVIPNIMDRPDQAKRTKAELDMKSISQTLELYRLDNNRYPSTDQSLNALIAKPEIEPIPRNWKSGGYFKGSKVPNDPWGKAYIYLSPADNSPYEIISYGSDGMRGGEGRDADIRLSELE